MDIILLVLLSFQALPVSWNELQLLHIIFMAVNVVMWVSLYHAATVDPGYLPRNIPEYDRAIREVCIDSKDE